MTTITLNKTAALFITLLLFFGNLSAEDIHYSTLPKSVQNQIQKEWRNRMRIGMKKIVSSLPLQIDSITTIDSAVFLDNRIIYLASVNDEALKDQLEQEGENISINEFWESPLVMSYMKTHMYSHSKNYVCSNPGLRVHIDIGTITGVEYRYIRNGGHHLFETKIDNCSGYDLKPIKLPNGSRLFP